MRASHKTVLIAGLASILATAAFSAERTDGRKGADDPSRATAPAALGTRKAKQAPAAEFDPSAFRGVMPTAEKAGKTFALVGRTRDGKVVRKEPDEAVIKALLGQKTSPDQRGALDPAREKGKAVIGKDNRVRITNTDEYPYAAIGALYKEYPKGSDEWYFCTAALVGPRTILTSAACLYWHDYGKKDGGGWYESFEFWPGVNGNDDAPFGSFQYDTAYVFDGWLSEYDGTWGSVAYYNIGVITLSEPIGDELGYLGYWDFGNDLAGLDANLVGYHYDEEPPNTMWRSRCEVRKKDIGDFQFVHKCDVGDNDVPLFVYDGEEPYVVGMHVATTNDDKANVALRLYGPIYEWIKALKDGEIE